MTRAGAVPATDPGTTTISTTTTTTATATTARVIGSTHRALHLSTFGRFVAALVVTMMLPLVVPRIEAATTFNFQPKVRVVESQPAHHGISYALSSSVGTPWCQGRPTFWITGHQTCFESPRCLVNGTTWVRNNNTVLDAGDALNGPLIDRHYCVTMDVNRDNLTDIICQVGAVLGTGDGYTELYLTQPDGSVQKMLSGHGLQKYPTTRHRVAATLKNKRGEVAYVLFGTKGLNRTDGLINVHTMFKNVYTNAATLPYFREVFGPWRNYQLEATCVVAADINGDGRDDAIICHKSGPPLMVIQVDDNDKFLKIPVSNRTGYGSDWRNVRVADVTQDGIKDLVVVTWQYERRGSPPPYLRIFQGLASRKSPFFNFTQPIYQARLPFAAPDVAILDVNRDGIPDIYVVQANETAQGTCNTRAWHAWDNLTCPDPNGPPTFLPPLDKAKDFLFVGQPKGSAQRYKRVVMNHTLPGCGWAARRWAAPNTMLLQGASFNQRGYSAILTW